MACRVDEAEHISSKPAAVVRGRLLVLLPACLDNPSTVELIAPTITAADPLAWFAECGMSIGRDKKEEFTSSFSLCGTEKLPSLKLPTEREMAMDRSLCFSISSSRASFAKYFCAWLRICADGPIALVFAGSSDTVVDGADETRGTIDGETGLLGSRSRSSISPSSYVHNHSASDLKPNLSATAKRFASIVVPDEAYLSLVHDRQHSTDGVQRAHSVPLLPAVTPLPRRKVLCMCGEA
ncbi:hypothetical protein PsorP6_004880 [Peronosclerospora sorghi]|uniref:Uncharacterized protein n=1 Tax=Peronosclerospora sorghi TaxID=230839 RepID=A0ACC0W6D4_9STRA|nr:hypothetical protein PsorP6_004880 [Peronosclerospora sorghi]